MSWRDWFRRAAPAVSERSSKGGELAALRAHRAARRRREYEMAADDRFAQRWQTTTTTPDGTIRYALGPLRARARELEENDPYVGRFFGLLESNVVGETGIWPIPEPPSARNRKKVDELARARIAEAFEAWSQRGTVTVCGKYSWTDLQKRILRSTGTDGEVFVRMVEGPEAGNAFDFALELLEADLLDESYSAELASGNVVRMGVELNRHRRPVAFHFLTDAPGDYLHPSNGRRSSERVRVPASQMIHSAMWNRMRPGSTRAVSWLANVGPSLYQLHAYRKAEAVAARIGSEKMGFYVPDGDSGDFTGDHSEIRSDAFLQELEAGAWEIVPDGYKVEKFDVDHPSTAFDSFNKAMMRTVSAGLGVGYNALASDLESTSFSSMRAGALEDRAGYRSLQNWMVETTARPIYLRWLASALIARRINLDADGYARLSVHRWQTRGWAWVDPMKEAQGNKLAVELGSKLVGDIIAEGSGRTVDEHLKALTAEREKFAAAGLRHPTDEPPPDPPPPTAPPKPEEPEEPEELEGEE